MKENVEKRKPGPIISALGGLLSFLISSMAGGIVIVIIDNYVLATIVAGGLGGFLLGLMLRLGSDTKKLAIAGLFAMPGAMIFSFLVAELFGAAFPGAGHFLEGTWLPDIIAISLMGMIFGAVCGAVLYDRKAFVFFGILCGITAIPFGIAVAAMNAGHILKYWLTMNIKLLKMMDINFVLITLSLGLGIGLCIGLMRRKKEVGEKEKMG